MKITDLAIRNHVTIYFLMFVVVWIGLASYFQLPREASPDIKIPFVMVFAPYAGASPTDMEQLVTRKLENELKGLANLVEMTSSSSEGVATIVLEFDSDTEMSEALQKARDAIELAKPDLPADVREDLLIYELSAEQWPILQIVLAGDYDPVRLKEVAEDLQEEVEQISGVLGVDLTGGVEREVRVEIDPDRLRFYGISLQDVKDAIQFENITLPGGDLAFGTYEYQVRVPGEFQTVDEIGSVLVNLAAPTPVYLRDVATVSFGLADPETYSRKEGTDSITLSVKKRSGENIVRIAEEVRATLDRFQDSFPEGTNVTITNDQSIYVRDMVAELENNIMSGLLLVVAVLFLFLGFTNSLFVGAAIPFSMLITFIFLRALGITLNMVVLFSLILAVGMLVDNAIVIVENIYRHRNEGKGANEAASFGTHEVTMAVIASTATTVVAFGPLVLWPGIMGEFMKYLPITVIAALIASLLVALVFNPVLCARLMKPGKPSEEGARPGDRIMERSISIYQPFLRKTLRYKARTLGISFAALVLLLVLFGKFNAGVELFPDTEPQYASIQIEAPSGTRLELSNAYAHEAEKAVAELADLKTYITQVGAGKDAFGGSAQAPPNLSLISMEFVPLEERTRSSRDQLEELRRRMAGFTGANITIEKVEDGPPTGKPVNIEISGREFAVLGSIADRIKARIRGVPGLVDLEDDYDRGRPEIQIRPDLEKAARYGLRRMDVASTILTAIRGEEVTQYRIGEDEYDIVVRFAPSARRSVEDLRDLTIFYEGQYIPLEAFAEVSYEAGLGAIQRLDGRRVVTVTADVGAGYNGNAVLAEVQKALSDFSMPPGYRLDYTGESEDQEEAQAFLGQAFQIALLLIFLVMVAEFASITVPIVIMTSVILSLIGVFFGLLITRTPFGIIMTGVGVISLAGVVVNNAIVLLDYTIQLQNRGMEKVEALVTAGRTRFRPVMLTAVTTILGLIPLTTGLSLDFDRLFHGDLRHALIIGGESSQWWGPMGVAVIWGLTVATILTLVVVPVAYASLDEVKAGFRRAVTKPASLLRRRAAES